jgi:UDP-N-acetyl-D-glucosamine dehydrogenase
LTIAMSPSSSVAAEHDGQVLRLLPDLPNIGVQGSRFDFDVAIVGLGYVGLPTALSFHAVGRRVLGVDVSAARLSAIGEERVDLLDTDRDRLGLALNDDGFTLTADPARLSEAATVIVCVPTPIDAQLVPDLSLLAGACRAVVAQAVTGQMLILTSTTYVGCTRDMLVEPLAARGLIAGGDVYVAFSPERIDPGNDRHAHEDVPRVVGGATPECTARASATVAAYARHVYEVSSAEAAEMTKLLENTFRAVNIAMVNEFADACRQLGLDVMEVIAAASTKPYGFMRFTPGPGVGGHCIPCDPHYLLWQLRKHRLSTPVIEQAMVGIAARPGRVVNRAREVLSLARIPLTGARVLLVGVAYKADVQDLRESPALEIAEGLRAAGAVVGYHDPLIPTMRLSGGDVLVSVVDPHDFRADLVLIHTLHTGIDRSWLDSAPLILDTTYAFPDSPRRVCL